MASKLNVVTGGTGLLGSHVAELLRARGERVRAVVRPTSDVAFLQHLGVEGLHPLSPLTTTLNYGVIAPDGSVDVRLVYDHRVLDGAAVARALEELEHVLSFDLPQLLLPGPPTAAAARRKVETSA